MILMLSDYDPYDFDTLDNFRRPNFMKWNGAIDLSQSGIPSIDVLLLDSTKDEEIIPALERFMAKNAKIGDGDCCIRFDHPALPPNRPAVSGILRNNFSQIIETVRVAHKDGWIPSVWIFGGDRENIPTICALSFRGDGFVADFLPSGFEGHDISKGFFTPSVVIKTKQFAPSLRELSENPANLFYYLDFWREDPMLAESKRERRLAMCAGYRGISVAKQTEIYSRQNPGFFEGYLGLTMQVITELVRIAADFADFHKARGFKLENTTIGMDLLPNGHWFLVNLWNAKKFG